MQTLEDKAYSHQDTTLARKLFTFCRVARLNPFTTSLSKISPLNYTFALRSKTNTCEDPPISNLPMHSPFVMSSPCETMGMQLETSTIPTTINATLPRAGLCVLMMKT